MLQPGSQFDGVRGKKIASGGQFLGCGPLIRPIRIQFSSRWPGSGLVRADRASFSRPVPESRRKYAFTPPSGRPRIMVEVERRSPLLGHP